MGVEAARIDARAIEQAAAPLRMALAGGRRIDEAEGGNAGKRTAGGDHEVTP
jgi:hypothetical protein